MLTALLCCLAFSFQDDPKERIADLKKQIADLRDEIAEKEAAIVRLSPVKKVPHLYIGDCKPGMVGPFGARFVDAGGQFGKMTATIRVESIIDGKTMIVSVLSKQKPIIGQIAFDSNPKQVIVSNYDTSKILPGTKLISPPFLMLGNRVANGVSYLHVDRYRP